MCVHYHLTTKYCVFPYNTEVLVFIQKAYMRHLCHHIICANLTVGSQTFKTHYVAQITSSLTLHTSHQYEYPLWMNKIKLLIEPIKLYKLKH